MASLSILIIEPESSLVKAIEKSLKHLGYAVAAIAQSGMEAIAKAATTQPDLILMDIDLEQQISDLQAATELWTHFRIPIVFLTVSAKINLLANTENVAAFSYISKPFREQDLQTAIEMAIYKHRLEIVQARAEELEIQVAELERVNHLKDDFLSTVSHELRTPMANIRMAVKMLEISLARTRECAILYSPIEASDRAAQRYLQILKDECNREIELIENILDLQRLEAEGQTFIPEVIHLQTLLPQLAEPFLERAKERQQILQLDLPKNLDPIISDTASIGRIVAELLNNACKYTPLEEKIILAVKVTANKIQLQVCNTGVEIPAKELAHVFEKFYRVPCNDPWKQGGTGLGLALVQKLCKQLGGAIAAESSNMRTCFTVELPIELRDKGDKGDKGN